MKKKVTAVQLNDPWHDESIDPYISIEDLTIKNIDVLKSISLSIYKGEFFSILGESGCGKSTLLRAIAGLEELKTGRIILDKENITDLKPYNRPTNMMFQSYALFPNMSVMDNITFGLKQENAPKQLIEERLIHVLELTKLHSFLNKYPDQLSGGQKQRVALARCLVKRPKVILLDEPLTALDKNLREETQFELVNIQEKVGITFIMVTHDQEEAMTMSTRMAIMNEGKMLEVGTPGEIYEYPSFLYTANFIGSINTFEGVIVEESDGKITMVESGEVGCLLKVQCSGEAIGSRVHVGIRPEKVKMIKKAVGMDIDGKHNCISGLVHDIAYLGDISIYYVEVEGGKIIMATQSNVFRIAERPISWDDEVVLSWSAENSLILNN